MRPIPAIPNNDARSDQSDGSCAQLRKEIMTALDRVANLPHATLGFAPLGRVQAKACTPRPLLRGPLAIRAIGLHPGPTARIEARDRVKSTSFCKPA